MHTKISSGMPQATPPPGQTSTDTPRGEFNVQSKMPSKHMGDGNLTADLNAYELPGVPWVCFFEPENGVATHGTYWHTNYGTTMSHGCVNSAEKPNGSTAGPTRLPRSIRGKRAVTARG